MGHDDQNQDESRPLISNEQSAERHLVREDPSPNQAFHEFEIDDDHYGENSSGRPLWYFDADTSMRMKTRGRYPGNYPLGAVVHFTAGRFEKGDYHAEATINWGNKMGHCYFCISTTGKVYQTAPLDSWGSHAGSSRYDGLGYSLSRKLVGIEITCAGKVKRNGDFYEPWWNKTHARSGNTYLTRSQVRYVNKTENITAAGYYHRYTQEQEDSLTALLLWMHENGDGHFSLDRVLGHDEIAVNSNGQLGRKTDPGGSLSHSMPAYRKYLKALAANGHDRVWHVGGFDANSDQGIDGV